MIFCFGQVVLSAGTYFSPQLLMLSGVGTAKVLREAGISVLADIPGVGSNLQVTYKWFVNSSCHPQQKQLP